MLVKLLFFSLILSPNNHEEMLIMPGKATLQSLIMIVIVFKIFFILK